MGRQASKIEETPETVSSDRNGPGLWQSLRIWTLESFFFINFDILIFLKNISSKKKRKIGLFMKNIFYSEIIFKKLKIAFERKHNFSEISKDLNILLLFAFNSFKIHNKNRNFRYAF